MTTTKLFNVFLLQQFQNWTLNTVTESKVVTLTLVTVHTLKKVRFREMLDVSKAKCYKNHSPVGLITSQQRASTAQSLVTIPSIS